MSIRFAALSAAFIFLLPHVIFAETPTLRTGGPKSMCLLPLIAVEKGFLEREGVQASYRHITTGKMTMDALLSGSLDFGCIVDSNAAFIRYNRTRLRLISKIMQKGNDGLVFSRAAGISDVATLRGKRIGYLPATTSHIFLDRLLQHNGMSFDDITPVILQPPAMAAAIRSGFVDAVSIWEPWRHNIRRERGQLAGEFKNSQAIYPALVFLASTTKSRKKFSNKEAAIEQALQKATRWINENPEQARILYARRTNLPNEIVEAIWHQFSYVYEKPEAGQLLVDELVEWIAATQQGYEGKRAMSMSSLLEEKNNAE